MRINKFAWKFPFQQMDWVDPIFDKAIFTDQIMEAWINRIIQKGF